MGERKAVIAGEPEVGAVVPDMQLMRKRMPVTEAGVWEDSAQSWGSVPDTLRREPSMMGRGRRGSEVW